MTLTVLTYNTLFAGRDGNDDRRSQQQIALISSVRPDVFLMQEAKGLERDGAAGFYALEDRIGMRGFMAIAPRTGQNVAIFIRDPLRAVSFEADGTNFHHAMAALKIQLPHDGKPLTVFCVHLCPNGPAVRRREAAYLAVQAAAESLSLVAGDFNSASPHDPEPTGFAELPTHHRSRYLAEDLVGPDHTVLAALEAAGWVDLGNQLDNKKVPTVPSKAFVGTEFASMRCDYVLSSTALAAKARRYDVIRSPLTDAASDHYPVMVEFDIPL